MQLAQPEILDRDYAVIEKDAKHKVGEIIVVQVNGSNFTVKRLTKESNGAFYLRPENKEHDDIRPRISLEIAGVVTGLFRGYIPL